MNQLKRTYDSEDIIVSKHAYKQMEEAQFWDFEDRFDNRILGQEQAKGKINIYLYKIAKGYNQNKPVVSMLYGSSGVGKTETA
ncbi:hypothetical protein [Facklamia sp. P9177]|uniref:hypothetical protein n=1 Tax=Facklamia sp. P9177 TaxID=3421945 RepID=UPI003D162B90